MHKSRKSNGHLRATLERRRSNAAQPHRNRKKYSRKDKYRDRAYDH